VTNGRSKLCFGWFGSVLGSIIFYYFIDNEDIYSDLYDDVPELQNAQVPLVVMGYAYFSWCTLAPSKVAGFGKEAGTAAGNL
jgi:hypothetical protein